MANMKTPGPAFLPRFAIAASIGIVAVVSILITQSIIRTEPEPAPENLIAKNEDPDSQFATQQSEQKTQLAESDQSLSISAQEKLVQQETVPETQINRQPHTEIAISKEEKDLFFNIEPVADDSSLAVLTDVSEWLVDQQEPVSPDISDLPAVSDIDALFETT